MQLPPYKILVEHQPQQKTKIKKGSKGILTCWLILPFLLFLLGLIFFIILICNYNPTTQSLDSAISVTSQLGEDVQSKIWTKLDVSYQDCTTTNSKPLLEKGWPFAAFQGVDFGQITQVVKDSEYREAEEKESDSKEEKGIPYENLKIVSKDALNHKYHLCVKTLGLDEYIPKSQSAQCPADKTVFCQHSKVCVKTGETCPYTSLAKSSTTGHYFNSKTITSATNGANKQFVIGMRGGFKLPCKNPDYLEEKPSTTDYALYGIMNSGCDEYGAYDKKQAVEIFNDINYKTLLELNGIDPNTYPSSYFYDYIANKDALTYKIYAIHRPKVVEDSKCMNSNRGFAKLTTVRQYAGETNNPLHVYYIMGLVLSIIGVLFWLALLAKSKQTHKTESGRQLFKIVHIFAVVLAIFEIILFIHYMSEFQGQKEDMNTVKNSFKTAIDIGCYQDAADFNSAFDKVYDFVHNALVVDYRLIITLFCFGVVYLFLTLLVYAVIKAKKIAAFKPPYQKE